MAKIEQEIVVTIKTLIQGLNNVQSLSNAVKNLGKGSNGSLTSDFLKAGAAAGLTNQLVGKLVNGLEEVGSVGARALGGFVEEGIKFNASIESSKIGIATLLANTYDVKNAQGQLVTGADAFNAALDESDGISKKIQKSAIETGYLFQDVFTFFNSALIASAGQNTNVDQLVRLTQQFALAAGAAHIEVEKVRTGIQQILTGVVTVRNPLARVLFPGETTKQINETLKSYKAAGTLVDFLEKKMAVFGLSAKAVSQSFQALGTNLYDSLKVFAGEATKPAFDKIKGAMAFIIGQVVDLSGEAIKLKPTFQKIADIIGQILSYLGDRLLEIIQRLFGYLTSIADYLTQHKEVIGEILVSLYAIAEQVFGILGDVISIVGDIGEANSNTKNWSSSLAGVAIFVGFIRDLIDSIIGAIEIVVGLILQGIGSALVKAGQLADYLISRFGYLGAIIASIFGLGTAGTSVGQSILAGGQSLADSGLDKFINLANGGHTGDALNRLGNLPGTPADHKKSNNTFSPRTGLNSGEDAGKKAKRERDERLRAAKQLYDEIEKYQIANARREVELAEEVNKQVLSAWQNRYDEGLVSADAFYKKKAELEDDDLARQQAELLKEQKFAKQALGRDLGALSGQFQLSPDAVDATIAKLDALNPDDLATADTKTIKQSIEYIKYLEQTADITQKLTKIELTRKGNQAANAIETEKVARANKTLLDSLGAEFASSVGDEGLKDLVDLHKRISDELPKVVSETNKGLPGVEQFAKSIHDAAEVDTTGIMTFLADAGIDFNSLSEEARVFIKLMERLEGLAKNRLDSVAGG
jgi:hypothetical protein